MALSQTQGPAVRVLLSFPRFQCLGSPTLNGPSTIGTSTIYLRKRFDINPNLVLDLWSVHILFTSHLINGSDVGDRPLLAGSGWHSGSLQGPRLCITQGNFR